MRAAADLDSGEPALATERDPRQLAVPGRIGLRTAHATAVGTRATLASGAPLTRAVTVTAAPGRTVSVSPGPAVAVPSSRDALNTNATRLDSATQQRPRRSLDEVGRRKALRVHDGLRPPDRLTRRVRVAAAQRGYPPALPQQLLPDPQRQLVIDVPQPVPDFHRVHVLVTELPCAARQRYRWMRRHHHAAVCAHLPCVIGKNTVAGCVSPVDPSAGRQPDRQPVPVPGGDLLARDHVEAGVCV